jgi:hypothetical protein
MKTKAPVVETQEKIVEDYWFKHYLGASLCSLCGNKGVIDTRLTAREGRLNYCICPNGRVMRENPKEYPLQTKFNIVINGMKFEVVQTVLTYEDVVNLVFDTGRSDYTMTYSSNAGGGILHKGQNVKVTSDMYFTVLFTGNA